jgi:diacylglycerol O-acyltransferase
VGRKKLTAMDVMFLAAESREAMMHVGALYPFTPPPGAGPQFLRQLSDELRSSPGIQAPWNLRLSTPELLKNPLQSWTEDTEFDMDYHVRRSALPSPGDERELGILVSRLHGIQMDFHRPLWEVHFIEGLADGRFALYFKVHHALMDGYTGMRVLSASLSADPAARDTPMFFSHPPPRQRRADPSVAIERAPAPTLSNLFELVREQTVAARSVGRALLNVFQAARRDDRELVAPLQAPYTIFNRRVTRNRRFATLQLPVERLRRIGKAAGGTLNDVCLALCGAALRRLLLDLDALPAQPLIAMLPVNVRPKDDPGGGNAVGAILASLATDVADHAARLDAIIGSTRRAKDQLQGLSRTAILQYSALLMAPLMLSTLPGIAGHTRPAFNLIISNVPGPEQHLYFRGARLEATYPLSIPFQGYGLNITITSYAGTLNFGFIGCRHVLPHLQRLSGYAADAADDLERAHSMYS